MRLFLVNVLIMLAISQGTIHKGSVSAETEDDVTISHSDENTTFFNDVTVGPSENQNKPSGPILIFGMTPVQYKKYQTLQHGFNISTVVIGVVGLVVNILNLIVWSRKPLRSSSTSVYLLALSVSDWLYLLVNIIFRFGYFGLTKFSPVLVSYKHTLVLQTFTLFAGATNSVYIVCAMTIERFIAIAFPTRAALWCTVRKARIMVIVITFISILLNLPYFFRLKAIYYTNRATGRQEATVTYTTFGRDPQVNFIFNWFYVALKVVFPVLVLVIFNSALVYCLYRSRGARAKMTAQSAGPQEDSASSKEAAVTRMIALLVFLFLALMASQCYANLISALKKSNIYGAYNWRAFNLVGSFAWIISSTMNFFIYSGMSNNFRKSLWNVLGCRATREFGSSTKRTRLSSSKSRSSSNFKRSTKKLPETGSIKKDVKPEGTEPKARNPE